MKFMGSKRHLLGNGLGHTIAEAVSGQRRFVDLFAGSGAVAVHVAQAFAMPVIAVDLQSFSHFLAGSIILRTRSVDPATLIGLLLKSAESNCGVPRRFRAVLPSSRVAGREFVIRERRRAAGAQNWFTRAYGGYYFSRDQADALGRLRDAAESMGVQERFVVIASLIRTASRICAAPGHTAQPFAARKNGLIHIRECWGRSVLNVLESEIADIAKCRARVKGRVIVGDAVQHASAVEDGDVVFLDPPYSGVHYSRFYHVLESLARGSCAEVSGTGRYPPPSERPRSDFSMKSTSMVAMTTLLTELSKRDVTVLLTYPEGKCSNGLYGKDVVVLARQLFSSVTVSRKKSRFSTLGGNGDHRSARQKASELIITMQHK